LKSLKIWGLGYGRALAYPAQGTELDPSSAKYKIKKTKQNNPPNQKKKKNPNKKPKKQTISENLPVRQSVFSYIINCLDLNRELCL
jgi:hypothetical protein